MGMSESRESAGESIYAALYEAAPSLQSLFTTPRAVQAMRFMSSFSSFATSLDNPPKLKVLVETLGFGHLHLDSTVPRVVMIRDAILDLLMVEVGEEFEGAAREGWRRLLNYIGGAIIFVKVNYADRINILLQSWKIANEASSTEEAIIGSGSQETAAHRAKAGEETNGKMSNLVSSARNRKGANNDPTSTEGVKKDEAKSMQANLPTSFTDMFKFNAAVMGFGQNLWLGEVLACFDNIVLNVANSARLQEECDVLVLRIAKVAKGMVNFAEYKSCMLASLRSRLPKDWSTNHEVAWSWLWENVERMLVKNMGNPAIWEVALAKFYASMDETMRYTLRKDIYARFFAVAPAGQDYFKQSNTYLHFIADRILDMTSDIYRDPVKMVDDISALGLRHVGYGIPTELFSPFVTACVEVVVTVTKDETTVEAFRWSLGLISKMLTRTITEGSTLVMKAINQNSMQKLMKALNCAPRGVRAEWMLKVQVGTQSISPLSWAIQSGSLDGATAVIQDLLTIRADRERYYYGADELFNRHPDIIQRLLLSAPAVLPVLLDGLIWRARTTEAGMRRVNYFLKHLVVQPDGKCAKTLQWIAESKDPKIVCHPVLILLSDIVWSRVACTSFLKKKSVFFMTLVLFIVSQSILEQHQGENKDTVVRVLIFVCRTLLYLFSLTVQLLYVHGKKCFNAFKTGNLIKVMGIVPVPSYLFSWQDSAGFVLMLCLTSMLILEPILWCMGKTDDLFDTNCDDASNVAFTYSVFSMIAVFLYYALLIDLTVMSTKVSAYVLVGIRMISEVGLTLTALAAVILTFSAGLSALDHQQDDFSGIPAGLLSFFKLVVGMLSGEDYDSYRDDPAVLVGVIVFVLLVTVFLLSLLVAQLTCAYESVYSDMVGYARLERVEIIVATLPNVSESKWNKFIASLKLDTKIEFNAGDTGLAGGIQVLEPASQNPTTVDMIKRYGGSTEPENPWPDDFDAGEADEDRFGRLEKLVKKMTRSSAKAKSGGAGGTPSGSNYTESLHDKGPDAKDAKGASETHSETSSTA